ncbi:MAG TPA: DUF1538 family protein [Rhodothermales bacterium]|nr:DUF1538 family protein [Rhodothermales bacterium]
MDLIFELVRTFVSTAGSVLPVILFMLFFYLVSLKQKLVHPVRVTFGFVIVVVGLSLLLLGLDKALFPVGRLMVSQLTAEVGIPEAQSPQHWSSYYLVYAFAFCITLGACLAEPALRAISLKVNEMSGGAIRAGGLRIVAALGVALGVTLGCIRIIAGIPLHWCIITVFALILLQTLFAPRAIIPLAYDTGGVSTTAVTVPVVTALGLALGEQLPGRNALADGFGLIALACLLPAVTVLAYAQLSWLVEKRLARNAIGKEE